MLENLETIRNFGLNFTHLMCYRQCNKKNLKFLCNMQENYKNRSNRLFCISLEILKITIYTIQLLYDTSIFQKLVFHNSAIQKIK